MRTYVYHIHACRRCGGRAKLEYSEDITIGTYSRVRCTACDRHTAWRPTRFQAEIDWEEMAA